MNKLKKWLVAAGLTIASLFGYHHTIPETSTIEIHEPAKPTPVAIPEGGQRINIGCDATCGQDEIRETTLITEKLLDVESKDCFKNYVAKNVDQTQINGLSLDAAIDLVLKSKVSTEISYYYQGRNWFTKTLVIGYENGDGKIHANRAAWNYMSLCEKVSNVGHEISHGDPMNFSHDFNQTARRPYSMPYTISSAIDFCCQ